MIIFPHTRQRRLSVRLEELKLGEAIALCKLPSERYERGTTELLRFIARSADKPRETFVTDPLLWTVEERTLLVAQYLAHVTSDGPDFSLGTSRLSNYADFMKDSTFDETELGLIGTKTFVMRHLLGAHAQALESVCQNRGDWIIGAMACRIFEKGAPVPDWSELGDIAIQGWINDQMEKLKALPESIFDALYAAYRKGALDMVHFFTYDFDDDGIVCLGIEEEGDGPHAPARFLFDSCVSQVSKSLS